MRLWTKMSRIIKNGKWKFGTILMISNVNMKKSCTKECMGNNFCSEIEGEYADNFVALWSH